MVEMTTNRDDDINDEEEDRRSRGGRVGIDDVDAGLPLEAEEKI